MTAKIVDAKNLPCPRPLILVKKALLDLADGEVMTVFVNNETARQNVERFLSDNGASCDTEKEGDTFTMTVRKIAGVQAKRPQSLPEEYCRRARGRHVICFTKDSMGTGDEDLGSLLVKSFINTIKDTSPLPETLVFYNSGIKLTLDDSPVAAPLLELEKCGIRILVCGTCLDFFRKKEKVRVGTVSNMFDILAALSNAGHVVYP